jgi:hypothetical protein
MGQHDALKKYWQSSQYAETLQVVISEDGGLSVLKSHFNPAWSSETRDISP